METKEKKLNFKWHYAFVILLVIIAMQIAMVTLLTYTSSLFLTQVAEHFGVGMGTVQLRFTVHSLVVIAIMPFIQKLYNKFSFKLLLVFGLVCYCCAFLGFSVCTNIWQYVALGGVQGIGSALALFIPASYMTNSWFNKGNALAIAIPSVVASLLSTITTPWVQNMITNSGWQYAMRICAILGLAISIPMVLLFAVPTPESKGMRPFGFSENKQSVGNTSAALTVNGVSIKNARRSSILWMFVIIGFIASIYSTVMRYMSPLCVSYGLTAEQAARCISAYTLGSSLAMPVSSLIVDKIGVKRSTVSLLVLNIIGLGMIMFCGGNVAIAIIGCVLYAFCGMNFISTVGAKEVFGMMDYPAIYSMITIGSNVSLLVGTTLFGYIYDMTGSYNALVISTIVCCVIVLIFTIIIYSKKDSLPWEERAVANTK